MSDLDDAKTRAAAWLEPLGDPEAPCGPDLEYDNDFLALTQAVAGKPESQFGPAEPPDWRKAAEIAEGLFDRTRDLRVAIDWARCQLHMHGYGALVPGIELITGLLDTHWDHLHPLPDPDDGDLYGRVNALTLLREQAGLLGDLRDARVIDDRAIGVLLGRDVEAALGLAPVTPGRDEMSKEQVSKMLAAALDKAPALRGQCTEAVVQVRALMSRVGDRLSSEEAPDLRPLHAVVKGIADLLPAEADESEDVVEDEAEDGAGEGASGGRRGAARGLSGSVTSRDEAMRAIDLVIEYLERTEPTNPAPLFLRRARQLVGHNFLQLMKVLAPDALAEVARVVGVDPESIEDPDAAT
ncbi:MAG: type VI secretion system protein TssA [Leptothrix sp. (in: Bacteria)]|nr:type VI secretion system protein TssA [Leptothrix sp. (in: b-proteobacteria)]